MFNAENILSDRSVYKSGLIGVSIFIWAKYEHQSDFFLPRGMQ